MNTPLPLEKKKKEIRGRWLEIHTSPNRAARRLIQKELKRQMRKGQKIAIKP